MKVDCWACYNNIKEEDRYKAHTLEKKFNGRFGT